MTPIRKKEIEQLTMRILSAYHISDNPGKHLQEIISGEKITLIDYHDWSEEVCGRFLFIDDEPAIFYNAKHTEAMQAFTIAHELGHYFLRHLDDMEAEIIALTVILIVWVMTMANSRKRLKRITSQPVY